METVSQHGTDDQDGPEFVCIGCEKRLASPFAFLTNGTTFAPVCGGCSLRSLGDTRFRDMTQFAFSLELTVPDIVGAFERLGLAIPTTPAEAAQLMGRHGL